MVSHPHKITSQTAAWMGAKSSRRSSTTFRVWAPAARAVYINGHFGGVSRPLLRSAHQTTGINYMGWLHPWRERLRK